MLLLLFEALSESILRAWKNTFLSDEVEQAPGAHDPFLLDSIRHENSTESNPWACNGNFCPEEGGGEPPKEGSCQTCEKR
jgi:hypothetical protein